MFHYTCPNCGSEYTVHGANTPPYSVHCNECNGEARLDPIVARKMAPPVFVLQDFYALVRTRHQEAASTHWRRLVCDVAHALRLAPVPLMIGGLVDTLYVASADLSRFYRTYEERIQIWNPLYIPPLLQHFTVSPAPTVGQLVGWLNIQRERVCR